MKNIFSLINCPLFAGIKLPELEKLLGCIPNRRKTYKKGNYILSEGDRSVSIGILLSGSAFIVREDFWGNRSILSGIGARDLFAEAFCCAGEKTIPVSVIAAETAEVLFLDYKHITVLCSSACSFHSALIRNLLQITARKNMALVEKIEHLTKRTTRNKLLSYFSEQARLKGSHSFQIPFNRQELADYLAVDHSAMSAELARMKKEGLLDYHKNNIELYAKQEK